ncbi:MAG: hypothetical protein HY297_02670 [Thaumarchaeota archaeon]|nr:hypothetical protein [Nitrososphaerota archaeon]
MTIRPPSATVALEARLSPSEDTGKVAMAVRNLVGESFGEVAVRSGAATFVSEDSLSLERIHDQLRDRHVRGAARRLLLKSVKGDSAVLLLNRQAAAVGVAALCASPEESPLGPIYLRMRSRKVEGLIDWLSAYEGG